MLLRQGGTEEMEKGRDGDEKEKERKEEEGKKLGEGGKQAATIRLIIH
jgi:hypothetical protein